MTRVDRPFGPFGVKVTFIVIGIVDNVYFSTKVKETVAGRAEQDVTSHFSNSPQV